MVDQTEKEARSQPKLIGGVSSELEYVSVYIHILHNTGINFFVLNQID